MNTESIPFLLFDISISKEHSLKIMSLEHTVNYNLITTQNRAHKIKIQDTELRVIPNPFINYFFSISFFSFHFSRRRTDIEMSLPHPKFCTYKSTWSVPSCTSCCTQALCHVILLGNSCDFISWPAPSVSNLWRRRFSPASWQQLTISWSMQTTICCSKEF